MDWTGRFETRNLCFLGFWPFLRVIYLLSRSYLWTLFFSYRLIRTEEQNKSMRDANWGKPSIFLLFLISRQELWKLLGFVILMNFSILCEPQLCIPFSYYRLDGTNKQKNNSGLCTNVSPYCSGIDNKLFSLIFN